MQTKTWRTWLHHALTVGGILLVLIQAVRMAAQLATAHEPASYSSIRLDVGLILLGVLLNQIGVWKLANHLFVDRRVYLRLRSEVDQFLQLVGTLNRKTIERDDREVEYTRERLMAAVDRIVDAAGVPARSPEAAAEALRKGAGSQATGQHEP